ncbi:MAG: YncE family protein, partial [Bacteroidetes bacterium]|nr:YncE family protein [Bacteroidota bacterium]
FNNYKSPQNYLDVAEVTAVRGDVIDGKSTWEFKIAPGQTITILVYYKQLQFKYLIPTIKI